MATLYHYTTPAGLVGILESKGIWLTDTRFLNDRNEFKTGWDVFHTIYETLKHGNFSQHADFIELIDGARKGLDQTTAHVASFSLNGDVLSQWRGYNGGYGFAIGFDDRSLFSAAQAQNFEMGPVAYKTSDHFEIMKREFDFVLKELAERGKPVRQIATQFWTRMQKIVLVLKDRHFDQEEEVRLYTSRGSDPEGVKVRAAPRSLVPYLQMQLDQSAPLWEPHKNLGIQHIIVGPAMSENQKMAAEFLLKQHRIDALVVDSSIPYIGA